MGVGRIPTLPKLASLSLISQSILCRAVEILLTKVAYMSGCFNLVNCFGQTYVIQIGRHDREEGKAVNVDTGLLPS